MSRRSRPLAVAGAYVALSEVEFLPEAQDHRTPESILIARENEREAQRAVERDMPRLRGLSAIEASVLTYTDGLCGQPRLSPARIAALLLVPEKTVEPIAELARTRMRVTP